MFIRVIIFMGGTCPEGEDVLAEKCVGYTDDTDDSDDIDDKSIMMC